MKKTEKEKGYKYIYHYSEGGKLLEVKMYRSKLAGLINEFQGKYEFIYDNKGQLVSQRNTIKNIGLTEAVGYFHENGKLKRKEYYNSAMALRYYLDFFYDHKGNVKKMEIHQYTGREIAITQDKSLIENYLAKHTKKIDFLSEMLDLADKIKGENKD